MANKEGWKRKTFRDLIRDYKLTGRARRLAILPGSPFIGHRLDDLRLRQRYGANVVGIERWRKFRRVMVSVAGNTELRLNDVLLIDMSASEVDLREFCTSQRLEPMVLRGEYFSEQARDVGMAEVSLIPDSELIGKTLYDVGFRSRYGLSVVGIRRNGEAMDGLLTDEPLQLGDILLVIGDWRMIRQLQSQKHVMLVCLFVLCATIGLFISNTATTVLMAPIAIAAAKQMGVSPYPFAMIVAIAASAAFMTPVSSPVNTLVLGPGGYRFGDFVKVGVPFTVLVMIVNVIMVPWLYGF